jgi:hypothetical protein
MVLAFPPQQGCLALEERSGDVKSGLSKLRSILSMMTCGSVRQPTEKGLPFRRTWVLKKLFRAVRQPTDRAEEEEGSESGRNAGGFSVG